MGTKAIAKRVCLRYRLATEFPTEKALKNYLHDHPDADKSKHSVSKSEANPKAQKRFDETKRVFSDMTALQKKVENADPVAKKKFDKAYEKIFDAGESAGKDAQKLIKQYPDQSRLLQEHLREWNQNKSKHQEANDSVSHVKMQQAEKQLWLRSTTRSRCQGLS